MVDVVPAVAEITEIRVPRSRRTGCAGRATRGGPWRRRWAAVVAATGGERHRRRGQRRAFLGLTVYRADDGTEPRGEDALVDADAPSHLPVGALRLDIRDRGRVVPAATACSA